jgi:hypothetical protein
VARFWGMGKKALLGTAVALVAIASVVVATRDERDGELVTGVDETTTTSESTTTTRPTTTTTEAPTTTVAPPPPPTTAAAAPVCHNSYDEACGPLVWDRQPGPNRPGTVTVTVAPEHPRVGDDVTFTVTISSPDASIFPGVWSPGDATYPLIPYTFRQPMPQVVTGYGPWTPPPPAGGTYRTDYSWAYSEPGTYAAWFTYREHAWFSDTCPPGQPIGPGECPDPYFDEISGGADVTVTE